MSDRRAGEKGKNVTERRERGFSIINLSSSSSFSSSSKKSVTDDGYTLIIHVASIFMSFSLSPSLSGGVGWLT